jgi:hypothetical protein
MKWLAVAEQAASVSSLAALPTLWLCSSHQVSVSCSLPCSDTPSIIAMLRFHRYACTVAAVIIVAAAVGLHPAAATVTIPCSSASYSLQSHTDYTAADCGDLAPLVVAGRTWENSSLSLRNVAFWRLVGGAVGFKFNAATVKNVRITVTGSRFTLNGTATAALNALVLAVRRPCLIAWTSRSSTPSCRRRGPYQGICGAR